MIYDELLYIFVYSILFMYSGPPYGSIKRNYHDIFWLIHIIDRIIWIQFQGAFCAFT